jgi:hypothetical protein
MANPPIFSFMTNPPVFSGANEPGLSRHTQKRKNVKKKTVKGTWV